MTGVRLWNGDICDLQVDAIVVPAMPTLFMTYGVAASVKQHGGHGIEFEAVARGRQALGSAVATGGGMLAARHVIHAVSSGSDRRASAAGIDGATRSALRVADSLGAAEVAFPSLGSPVGGVPLSECARVMLLAIHETLPATPSVRDVVLALRGSRTYDVFREELDRQRMPRAVPVTPGSPAVAVPVEPANTEDVPAAATERRHPTAGAGR